MAKGLYKRGNLWWIRYSDGFGNIVRESSHSTKFKDAEALLLDRKKAVREGKEPDPVKRIPNYTFGQLADEYIKWCERQRSFSSKKGFIAQLKEAFGNIQLRHLSTKLLEQFQTERTQKGNKPATVNRLIATVKHCIHKGYQWEMLSEETFKRVRQVKLLEENNRRLRFLSQPECQALIDNCNGNTKAIVIMALNTGMRKGEILSIKWEQVDLRHGFIFLGITKNGERREIPINDTLRSVIKSLPTRLNVPYLFYDAVTGNSFNDIKRSFSTAMRRAGISDFHFHDLRHTFASHLVMAGVDITTVSKLLGHKSLTMTLRYSHLAPAHMAKALDILDNTLTGKPSAQKVHNLRENRNVKIV